jgi:pimeloyl-ACP methyl ester carboxylesterase
LKLFLPLLLALLPFGAAQAQDIAGTWQTDKPRYVMTITKAPNDYRGEWFNLGEKDGALNGNPLAVTLDGNRITIKPVRFSNARFKGMVTADAITGGWSQDSNEKLVLKRVTPDRAHPIDPAPHKILFVTVAPGVKLEVADFGGSANGPPLIFLPGMGGTAHVFDSLALKFVGKHRVYAITRRGHGVSDAPPPTDANYEPDRLGDDVLAVMAVLKIEKPVVAGHSVAGEELSSIGTRHPQKVAGLIYLDAAYSYAFYDPKVSFLAQDTTEASVRRNLRNLQGASPSQSRALIREIQALLPSLKAGLQAKHELLAGEKDQAQDSPGQLDLVSRAIVANQRIYTGIKPPILALVAAPPACRSSCKAFAAAAVQQADSVAAAYPKARVVRLARADHYIWRTHEADVVREMRSFMDGLR